MTCTIEGCAKPTKNRQMCSMHYERWRLWGDPLAHARPVSKRATPCSIEGCEKTWASSGLCAMQHSRMRVYGDPLAQIKRPTYGSGRVTSGKGGYVFVRRPGHVLADSVGYVQEHRLVAYEAGLLLDPTDHVHHVNEDKADNRVENLEVLTPADHTRRHLEAAGEVTNQYGTWPLRRRRVAC